ncbi:unnamed protein product, partial [Prorocentrum cordatum]
RPPTTTCTRTIRSPSPRSSAPFRRVLKTQAYDRKQASFVQVAALSKLRLIPERAKRALTAFLQDGPRGRSPERHCPGGVRLRVPVAQHHIHAGEAARRVHRRAHQTGEGGEQLGAPVQDADSGSNQADRTGEVRLLPEVRARGEEQGGEGGRRGRARRDQGPAGCRPEVPGRPQRRVHPEGGGLRVPPAAPGGGARGDREGHRDHLQLVREGPCRDVLAVHVAEGAGALLRGSAGRRHLAAAAGQGRALPPATGQPYGQPRALAAGRARARGPVRQGEETHQGPHRAPDGGGHGRGGAQRLVRYRAGHQRAHAQGPRRDDAARRDRRAVGIHRQGDGGDRRARGGHRGPRQGHGGGHRAPQDGEGEERGDHRRLAG